MNQSVAVPGTSSGLTNGFEEEDPDFDNWPQRSGVSPKMLLHEFQQLPVNELMKTGRVCDKWRYVSNHPSLWKVVHITDASNLKMKEMAKLLQKHGTSHLDLREMWFRNYDGAPTWQEFVTEMKIVNSLRKLEMGRCPAFVFKKLLKYNPNLEVINAVQISTGKMNIVSISSLLNLQELSLKSTCYDFTLTPNLTVLSELKNLKHLSLLSISNLKELHVSAIGDLLNLESLELGDCDELPQVFGSEVLSKLEKLEKLRLVNGQRDCHIVAILEAIKNLKQLAQVELINFEIFNTGFDLALGACVYIKKLLIIPTTHTQALCNHMIFGGVLRLWPTLTHFVWGISTELINKADTFLKEYEMSEQRLKMGQHHRIFCSRNYVPIQEPVPLLKDGVIVEMPLSQGPRQLVFLTISYLRNLLVQSLPHTIVNVFEIAETRILDQRIADFEK